MRWFVVLGSFLVLFALFPSPASAGHFVDVPEDHTFASDIEAMAREGITRGCNPPDNDRFCPSNPVTRGEMAAFLNRALELPPSEVTFRDTDGHLFEDDIASLAGAGITLGCNPPVNDRFCPNDHVTRQEMASFLTRALELRRTSAAGHFRDIRYDNVFASDINRLATVGITRGCNPPDNTRFCPEQEVIRGQMAAFLNREPSDPAPVANPPPDWLGTRELERGPTGFPPPQETPPELYPRILNTTKTTLPPPRSSDFEFRISIVPEEVLDRSTWHPDCPITSDELRWVTVSYWGFDRRHHTGEMLLHRDVAASVVSVFERLHEAHYPIEQMTITTVEERDAPPTGDGNNTSAFVCRAVTGSGSWSEHAYGRAIDINPFQNPYVREVSEGLIVLPELATAYLDRDIGFPGIIREDDVVVSAFDDIGWYWGGRWDSLKDFQHFSATGH